MPAKVTERGNGRKVAMDETGRRTLSGQVSTARSRLKDWITACTAGRDFGGCDAQLSLTLGCQQMRRAAKQCTYERSQPLMMN